MAEYAPGTVLEDCDGDRWTVDINGRVAMPNGDYYRSAGDLEEEYGPLKVVSEPPAWRQQMEDGSFAMKWETKDSGERKVYDSGMQRDTDEGKPRFDLLYADEMPFQEQMLTRFAHLMRRGAEKYGAKNWLKGDGPDELERAKGSSIRHHFKWLMGETDEDHAAAVMANIMFAEYFKWKMENK
jgi:hypothetical protein